MALSDEVNWPCLYRAQSAHITLRAKQISGVTPFIGEKRGVLRRKVNQLLPHSLKKQSLY